MANLPDMIGAIVAEGVGFLKTAGVTAGRAALATYLAKRADAAREILFDELRSGDIAPEQVAAEDDGVAVVHGFVRAAWEGKARVNLRLLAKAIKGQLQLGNLVADDFFLHADALASLSRDEIILLATMLRERARSRPNGLWLNCMGDLNAAGWSKDKILAVASRSLRSGFVTTGSGFGGMVYAPSPMLLDVCKTVDFDDALRKEPAR